MIKVPGWLRWATGSLVGGAGIVLIAGGLSSAYFGSPRTALGYLRGERIVVSPNIYDIGEGRSGEVKRASFRLQNLSRKAMTITGGTTTCTCLAQEQYPIRISPGASVPMTVSIKLSEKPGSLPQSLTLYTDDAEQAAVVLQVTGRVSPARIP